MDSDYFFLFTYIHAACADYKFAYALGMHRYEKEKVR